MFQGLPRYATAPSPSLSDFYRSFKIFNALLLLYQLRKSDGDRAIVPLPPGVRNKRVRKLVEKWEPPAKALTRYKKK